MTEILRYAVVDTAWGWIAILSSNKGLLAITFPQRTEQHALMALGRDITKAMPVTHGMEELLTHLRDYYDGHRTDFNEKLELDMATPFQRRVWDITRTIPYGETRSYLWIARRLGKPRAARAVGQALGANPLPVVIPCHRVIAADGRLGGFGGGLEMKRALLKMEAENAARH